VLEENVVRVLHHGEVAAEVPASALAEDTPINHHELISEPPAAILHHWQWNEDQLPAAAAAGVVSPEGLLGWGDVLLRLLDDPTIASKRWVWRQYDHQVQANTVVPPGGADAAVVRLRPQQGEGSLSSCLRGVAAVVDCPNRWVALDPQRGAMAAVAEAARNLSCVGAEPLAVTDNLNFPSPDSPTGYWQLALACRGLAEACRALDTPVTGGNVSLYNETRLADGRLQPIHPTPVVGMVGLVHDLTQVRGMAWRQPGDAIWLLGVPLEEGCGGATAGGVTAGGATAADDRVALAASSYLEVIHGQLTGRPPRVDLALEKAVQGFLRGAIAADLVVSAHDLADGGLAVAAAECCIASGLGAHLELPVGSGRLDRLLFAEGGGRVLVSVPPQRTAAWQEALDGALAGAGDALAVGAAVPARCLGVVTADQSLTVVQAGERVLELPLEQLQLVFEGAIPRRMGQAAPPPER
jgi:phosphoribosylformylglycinamidine synthase subunit PurL